MKHVLLIIGMLLIPVVSSDARGKPLGRRELKKYFSDQRVVELVIAANNGDVKKIDSLVAAGVDINAKGKDDLTPLLAAFASLNLEGFKRLLEHGANPNVPTESGDAVIWFVAMGGEKSDDTLPMLRLCLQHGGNPNWVFEKEYAKPGCIHVDYGRPLIAAVVMFNKRAIEALQILLAAGADINKKDKNGDNALWYAAEGHYEVLFFLLQSGIDYTAKDNTGKDLIWDLEQFPTVSFGDEKDMAKQRAWKHKVVEWLKEKGVEVHPKYQDF